MQSKLSVRTKFYNFSRKFWQVADLSLFFGGTEGGAEISLGSRPLAPLERPLAT